MIRTVQYIISLEKIKNVRISFKSYIPRLIKEVHQSLIKLNFKPSKIIGGKQIFLSSKNQVEKYVKEIGFKNQKHLKRFEMLKNCAPVV